MPPIFKSFEECIASHRRYERAGSGYLYEAKIYSKATEIPEAFFDLKLSNLTLIMPNLREIPDGIARLTRLEVLTIEEGLCALERISPEIGKLSDLRILQIFSRSRLSELPETIGDLKKLEILFIHTLSPGNAGFRLPDSIGGCERLYHLKIDASGSRLQTPPASLANCRALSLLMFRNAMLRSLPDIFHSFPALQTLDLSRNYLSDLPPSVGLLNSVTKLDLSYNRFTEMPEALRPLPAVEELEMRENRLKVLPDWIGEWTQLKDINASSNQLKTIPKSLGDCQLLTAIYLQHNKISKLPEIFDEVQLPHLKTLNLNDNRLSSLPRSFSRLAPDLRTLAISDNPIKADVPYFFLFIPKGRQLYNMGVHSSPIPRIDFMFRSPSDSPPYCKAFYCHSAELMQAFYDGDIADKHKEALYHIFCNNRTEFTRIGFDPFLMALGTASPILRQNARRYIEQREAKKWEKNPITTESKLALLGQFFTDTAVLMQQLEQAGIAADTVIAPETTHIFIGAGVQPKQLAKHSKQPLGTDDQLAKLLAERAQLHLVEQSKSDSASVASLRELLASPDESSVSVALEMLASGGVPSALWTDLYLFVAFPKKDFSKNIYTQTEELLRLYADPLLRALPRSYVVERPIYKGDWVKVWNAVEKGLLDIEQLYLKWEKERVYYLLNYLPTLDEAAQFAHIEGLIQRNNGFLSAQWYPEGYRQFYQHPSLRHLHLDMLDRALSLAGIEQLAQLEKLSLADNALREVPLPLMQLPQLKFLDISNNAIRDFSRLNTLPNLEEVCIWGNGKASLDPFAYGADPAIFTYKNDDHFFKLVASR